MTYRFLSPAEEELAHAMDSYEQAVPGLAGVIGALLVIGQLVRRRQ